MVDRNELSKRTKVIRIIFKLKEKLTKEDLVFIEVNPNCLHMLYDLIIKSIKKIKWGFMIQENNKLSRNIAKITIKCDLQQIGEHLNFYIIKNWEISLPNKLKTNSESTFLKPVLELPVKKESYELKYRTRNDIAIFDLEENVRNTLYRTI